MKIVIPGGTGQVGTILARAFTAENHEVVILSRGDAKSRWRTVRWDAKNLGDWANEFENADVVINLAGRIVNCRYTKENRRQIIDSRVDSTRVVGAAIANAKNPPRVWLQSSTATIYAHRYDAPNDEKTGIIGGDEKDAPKSWNFSIEVAKSWEAATNESDTPNTRKVLLRSAMIMSPDREGIFDTLLGLTKKGLGGTAGDGRQFLSWIHEADFINAVNWIIKREDLSGAINLASPNPLPNKEFMRILREAANVKIGLPATKLMLEVGAVFLQTETELVLKSRRVIPTRLLESNFAFKFPNWENASKDLYEGWRRN